MTITSGAPCLADLLAALGRQTSIMAHTLDGIEQEISRLITTGQRPRATVQSIDLVRQQLEAMTLLFAQLGEQMKNDPPSFDVAAALSTLPLPSFAAALSLPNAQPSPPGEVEFF